MQRYVLCLLFFNSNIITWIAVKLLYSWIYLYHSPTVLHYLWPHIFANSLPAGGTVGAGEIEVSPGNTVHKAELRSQTLLYQTLHARWNENDIQNFLFNFNLINGRLITQLFGIFYSNSLDSLWHKTHSMLTLVWFPNDWLLWVSSI